LQISRLIAKGTMAGIGESCELLLPFADRQRRENISRRFALRVNSISVELRLAMIREEPCVTSETLRKANNSAPIVLFVTESTYWQHYRQSTKVNRHGNGSVFLAP
jgi:hypothetical protein